MRKYNLLINRLDAIDGTRGVLAVMVMLSHMIGSFIGWPQVRPFSGAYLCVVYFFIMSGFVLSYAHSSGHFFKYLLTRLARLWPLHFLSTMLMVFVYYYNSKHGAYVSSNDVFSVLVILKNILFLHGVYWHDFQLINEPSWSISVEFWASLLIPVLFVRMSILLRFIISVILFVLMFNIYPSGLPGSLSTAVFSMLVGSLCFAITKSSFLQTLVKEKYFAIFVTVSVMISIIGVYSMTHNRYDYFLFVAFIPVLFIDYLPDENLVKRIFTSKLFVFLGYISFPLYLLHEAVIVSGFIVNPNNAWISISISALFAIFIAYIYTRFVDYPLYKALKKAIAKI